MSGIEQRLRDAFSAAGQTVDPLGIREVPRPAPRPGQAEGRRAGRVRTGPRTRRWDRILRPPRLYEALVPLAAAAAVTLIATTMAVLVPKVFPAGSESRHAAATQTAKQLATGYVGGHLPAGPRPRYFVGVREVPTSPGWRLDVYSAVTGRVVAERVSPPGFPHGAFKAVAAFGNDRSFVVAASPGRGVPGCHTWLYWFTLNPQGQPVDMQPLAVPKVDGAIYAENALAASADGSTVAYSAATCQQATGRGWIGAIHLTTASVTTWAWSSAGGPRELSLSANGALLSYVGTPSNGDVTSGAEYEAVWLVHTNAPSGELASRYRRVLHSGNGIAAAQLSATGAILFAASQATVARRFVSEKVRAYLTATGKPVTAVHVFRTPLMRDGRVQGFDGQLLSTDTSGHYALLMPTTSALQELNVITGRSWQVPLHTHTPPLDAVW